MNRQDFDNQIGGLVEVLPEDGYGFDGTILSTKDDGVGGYLVTVIDQEDNAFDVNPLMIKL